MMYLFFKFKFI